MYEAIMDDLISFCMSPINLLNLFLESLAECLKGRRTKADGLLHTFCILSYRYFTLKQPDMYYCNNFIIAE